jgi:hypothetical protein
VGIFHAVQEHQQLDARSGDDILQFGIALHGTEGHHTLVRGAVRRTVEGLSGLEADRHGMFARQIDDFLKTRPARSTSDQKSVERTSGSQGFAHGMNAGQKTARLA